MNVLIPGARYWVNGGFVTHKTWNAPADIDVVLICKAEELNALTPEEQERFDSLLTEEEEGVARRQPMGGLVDGFYTLRGSLGPGDPAYWNAQWSRVRGENKEEVLGALKGYLEVVL